MANGKRKGGRKKFARGARQDRGKVGGDSARKEVVEVGAQSSFGDRRNEKKGVIRKSYWFGARGCRYLNKGFRH